MPAWPRRWGAAPAPARARAAFAAGGVESALARQPPERVSARKLDGEAEARPIALACAPPLEGRARWTLRWLRAAGGAGSSSPRGSQHHPRRAQENRLKRWLKRTWCLPTAGDPAFIAATGDVLDVSAAPLDPTRPLVCFDEAGKALPWQHYRSAR